VIAALAVSGHQLCVVFGQLVTVNDQLPRSDDEATDLRVIIGCLPSTRLPACHLHQLVATSCVQSLLQRLRHHLITNVE